MCIINRLKPNAMITAATLGLLAGSGYIPFSQSILAFAEFGSEVFMRLLKMVSLPIIFLSITTTISGLTHYDELKETGSKVLHYTLATTICAASIALLLFLVIDPANAGLLQLSLDTEAIPAGQMSYIDYLINVIPSNMILAFAENNVIGTLLIAVGMGVASLTLPLHQKNTLHSLFSSLYSAIFKLTGWILKLVPFAIWAFIALFVNSLITQALPLNLLSLYLVCVIAANIIQAVVILPLLLMSKGLNPVSIFQQMLPALQIAFWSKSSSAALPVALQHIKKDKDVDPKIANISMPLCISINMNGCAAFILITVFFVAKCHGIVFSLPEMLVWVFIATLTAVGNAGVPMGCYFLSCALLGSMGIPLKIMGFILPFYAMIDMLESTINVWSDICVTLVVNADSKVSPNKLETTVEVI